MFSALIYEIEPSILFTVKRLLSKKSRMSALLPFKNSKLKISLTEMNHLTKEFVIFLQDIFIYALTIFARGVFIRIVATVKGIMISGFNAFITAVKRLSMS